MLRSSQHEFFCLWKRFSNCDPISLVRMISLGLVVEPLLRLRLAHLRAGEKNVALTAADAAYDYGLATLSCVLFDSPFVLRIGDGELKGDGHGNTRFTMSN